jgi:hypothetical protein
MPKENTLNEKVRVFLDLGTHEEKCAYFHEHPELATIFGGHHYPKPSQKSEVRSQKSETADSKEKK